VARRATLPKARFCVRVAHAKSGYRIYVGQGKLVLPPITVLAHKTVIGGNTSSSHFEANCGFCALDGRTKSVIGGTQARLRRTCIPPICIMLVLKCSSPIGTTITLPAKGMKSANQSRPVSPAIPIGNPVIMHAALTCFRTRGRYTIKPQLRSQDLAFA
jgi:hypothetical protein